MDYDKGASTRDLARINERLIVNALIEL